MLMLYDIADNIIIYTETGNEDGTIIFVLTIFTYKSKFKFA